MQEQELFQSYEVKNWNFSNRIYKILAFSAVFNILALLIIGQTNLLTTKGCDSPLVGKVCQVIDTLYVSGKILTTDSTYVSDPYTPTELTENDEITFVNVADKLYYPEGYFGLSNPELAQLNPDESFPTNTDGFQDIPGIPNPTTGGGGLMNQKQELPPANSGGIIGDLPTSPYGTVNGNNPTTKFPKNQKVNRQKNPTIPGNVSPNKLPTFKKPDITADKDNTDKENKDPNQTPVKNETVPGVVINKIPLKKLASDFKAKVEKKEVDLTQNFTVVADGVLTKEGTLDVTIDKKTKQPKSRILKSEGNAQMIEVAKQAIEAIGDSGWLGYLRAQGIEKINFTVVQDNDNLQVIITSDLATPERANTVSSGIGGVISAALLLDKNGIKKLGEDEKVLLSNAKTAVNPANTKQFVLNFVLPKATAQEMITRKLNEPEKPEDTKAQSTAPVTVGNKTAVK